MDEEQRRFSTFTKEDNRKIQVIQNKILRLKSGLGRDTPTEVLVKQSGSLSVNQLTAFATIMTAFRAITSGKPKYLSSKLKLRDPENGIFPQRQVNTIAVTAPRLNQTRSGFMYRSATLFNSLPVDLRKETRLAVFKRRVKVWITANISVKPP